LREILAGTTCVSPASVYDPLSAIADADTGFGNANICDDSCRVS
jgi:hypothetical protein